MKKYKDLAKHLPCIGYALAFYIGDRFMFLSQRVDMGLMFDLADDIGLLVVAAVSA